MHPAVRTLAHGQAEAPTAPCHCLLLRRMVLCATLARAACGGDDQADVRPESQPRPDTPVSPSLAAFYEHLAAEDDFDLRTLLCSNQAGHAADDQLADGDLFAAEQSDSPSAANTYLGALHSPWKQGTFDAAAAAAQLDALTTSKFISVEPAGTASGATGPRPSPSPADQHISYGGTGHQSFLLRQTSDDSCFTGTHGSQQLSTMVLDMLVASSPTVNHLQRFAAPGSTDGLTASPVHAQMPLILPAIDPLAHTYSSGSSLRRDLRLPTLLPPNMLHDSSAAGAAARSPFSQVPPALFSAVGLAAPPAAAVHAQVSAHALARAATEPGPSATTHLGGPASGSAGAPVSPADVGRADTPFARASSRLYSAIAAAGSAGQPDAAPQRLSSSAGPSADAAPNARAFLRNNSGMNSLASAHSFRQQLLDPQDSMRSAAQMVPAGAAHAEAVRLGLPDVTAAGSSAGAGAGPSMGPPRAVRLSLSGVTSAQAASKPRPKRTQTAARASSRERSVKKEAVPSTDADAAAALSAAPADTTAPAAPEAPGKAAADAASGRRKLRRHSFAPAATAPPAPADSSAESSGDEQETAAVASAGKKRRCSSLGPRIPKQVRELAELREQVGGLCYSAACRTVSGTIRDLPCCRIAGTCSPA